MATASHYNMGAFKNTAFFADFAVIFSAFLTLRGLSDTISLLLKEMVSSMQMTIENTYDNLKSSLDDLELMLHQMVRIDRARDVHELHDSIQNLLQAMGDYTKADRVFIFEFRDALHIYRNTYEWCAPGITPQIDNLQTIEPSDIPVWQAAFEQGENIVIPNLEDVRDTMPGEYEILRVQDIHSEISFPIFSKDALIGFLGLDNPTIEGSYRFINLLAVVGSHLGGAWANFRTSALLEQSQSDLRDSMQALQKDQQVLEALCRDYTCVYTLDPVTDRIELVQVDPNANAQLVLAALQTRQLSHHEIIHAYYQNFVVKASARDFLTRLDGRALQEELNRKERVIYRFRALPNSAGQEYFELQAVKINTKNNPYRILVGFHHIDDIVNEELRQQIADDVLDISRIESGSLKLDNVDTSITRLFQDTADTAREIQPEKHLQFFCDAHDIAYEHVLGDPLHLQQIYMNLLSNAIKYTPEGGEIHFEIYQELLPHNHQLNLISIIRDTGIGMSPEFMKEMYSKFSRAVDTRVNKVRGSGLGLTIVRELMELMQGTIHVHSTPGEGTCFKLTIPLTYLDPDAEPDKIGQKKAPAGELCKGMHLLVAEDNDLNYEVASELLALRDVTCDRAEDGAICVERFNTAQPFTYNAILMDIQMPVMDGLEATMAIRTLEHPQAKSIPIIAMTANAFTDDVNSCMAAGMNRHMSKPLNIDDLLEVLASYRN